MVCVFATFRTHTAGAEREKSRARHNRGSTKGALESLSARARTRVWVFLVRSRMCTRLARERRVLKGGAAAIILRTGQRWDLVSTDADASRRR